MKISKNLFMQNGFLNTEGFIKAYHSYCSQSEKNFDIQDKIDDFQKNGVIEGDVDFFDDLTDDRFCVAGW